MNKIWLTNRQQKNALLRQLFKDAQQSFISVRVMDFNEWLQVPEAALNHEFWLIKTMELVHEHCDGLEFYQGVDGSLAFAEQLLRLLQQLLSYRCDFSRFPLDTKANRDLALLLSKMQDWPVREHYLLAAIDHMPALEGVEVYQYQTLHPLELELLRLMGYQSASINYGEVEYCQALNDWEQLEWVVQDIINHGYDLADVHISCPPVMHPYLLNIMRRYQMWNGVIGQNWVVQLVKVLNRIVFHGFQSDDLLSVARLMLEHKQAAAFEKYVMLTKPQVKAFLVPFVALSDHSQQSMVKLFQKAEQARQLVMQIVEPLFSWQSLPLGEYCRHLFEVICPGVLTSDDRSSLSALKRKWQALPSDTRFGNDQLIDYICDRQTKLDIGQVQLTPLGIRLDAKVHYSLGHQHGTFLPGYAFNGLIDELLGEQLGLTSISQRKDQALSFAQAGFSANERLVIVVSQITSDGKPISRNLDLQEFFGLSEPIVVAPLLPFYNYLPNTDERSIQESTAKQLYLKDQRLMGSVSSFEKFNQCQYAYFMSYGIRIRPLEQFTMEVNTVGLVLHSVMEQLIKKHGNHYYRIAESELARILEAELVDFHSTYHYQPAIIALIGQTLLRQLMLFLQAMANYEQGSVMEPVMVEHQFTYDYDFGVTLRGIIDRIDCYSPDGLYSVIDYKTSGKQFSALELVNGLQLQLATYLMVVSHEFGQPLGAAYQSLQPKLLRCPAFEMKTAKAKGVDELLEKKQQVAYQRNGISLAGDDQQRLELLSNNGLLFYGIKLDKNNELSNSPKSKYEQHELFALLKSIYEKSTQQIIGGSINLNPKPKTCTYCDYLAICQYRGAGKALPKVLNSEGKSLAGCQIVQYKYGEMINE